MSRAGDLTRELLLDDPYPSLRRLAERTWPELGALYSGNTSRVIEYRGNRRIVAGVDERSGRVTAYIAQRQAGPCHRWHTVMSTSSQVTAAEWLADARLPMSDAASVGGGIPGSWSENTPA